MTQKLIVWIGILASLIGILVFISGRQSLHDIMHPQKAYEIGLPAAPPDIHTTTPLPVIQTDDDGKLPDSSCSLFRDKTAIVISADQDSAKNKDSVSYELSGEDGARQRYYMDPMGNANASWLDLIMVPGRRVRISGNMCGQGGILSLTRVEALSGN